MQTTSIDNGPDLFEHKSTVYGLIQRRINLERAEAERIEAAKSDVDRFHEDALRRFYDRANNRDEVEHARLSEAREKINLAQQVDESRRVYWRKTENGFEQISK